MARVYCRCKSAWRRPQRHAKYIVRRAFHLHNLVYCSCCCCCCCHVHACISIACVLDNVAVWDRRDNLSNPYGTIHHFARASSAASPWGSCSPGCTFPPSHFDTHYWSREDYCSPYLPILSCSFCLSCLSSVGEIKIIKWTSCVVLNSLPDELRSPDITLDHVQKQTEDVII